MHNDDEGSENREERLARIEKRDPSEVALEISAAFASVAPWLGGPISQFLTGKVNDRKFRRVADELKKLADDMAAVESETAKRYVKTEEFEDLLDVTMQKIAYERSEEKRALYRAFLANTVASPGQPWPEKQRFLRTIEEIEPDHIRLLKALLQEPSKHISPTGMGSAQGTIRKRAPEVMPRLRELSLSLARMGLANLGETAAMMTAHGAEDLRDRVTPYGRRFIRYVHDGVTVPPSNGPALQPRSPHAKW